MAFSPTRGAGGSPTKFKVTPICIQERASQEDMFHAAKRRQRALSQGAMMKKFQHEVPEMSEDGYNNNNNLPFEPAALEYHHPTNSKDETLFNHHPSSNNESDTHSTRTSSSSFLKQVQPHWSIIDASSRFWAFWESFHLVAMVYMFIMVPFVTSFLHYEEYFDHWSFQFDRCLDFFYTVDILLNFRKTHIDARTGEIISDTHQIYHHYLQGWFVFDVIVTIPWDMLLFQISASSTTSLASFLRLISLSRMAKLLRIVKIRQLLELLEDSFHINRNFIKVGQLVFVILLVAHCTACAFYCTAQLNSHHDDDDAYQPQSWIQVNAFEHLPVNEIYLISLYWAFTMMTTVGFGDIVPVNYVERVFSITTMLISAGIYAYTIASISHIVSNLNLSKSMYYARLNELNAYMRSRGFPHTLQCRTRKYYRYYLERKTVHDEEGILDQLPTALRHELIDHYVQRTICKIHFFDQVEKGFMGYIMKHLKPTFYAPSSVICAQEDLAQEMFIITKGMVQVNQQQQASEDSSVSSLDIARLKQGDHFGEMALLLEEQQSKRMANVRSINYCECYVIEYQDLQYSLCQHAQTLENLMSTALSRRMKVQTLRQTHHALQTKDGHKSTSEAQQRQEIHKKFKKMAAISRFRTLAKTTMKLSPSRASRRASYPYPPPSTSPQTTTLESSNQQHDDSLDTSSSEEVVEPQLVHGHSPETPEDHHPQSPV